METFGKGVFEDDTPVLDAFVSESRTACLTNECQPSLFSLETVAATHPWQEPHELYIWVDELSHFGSGYRVIA